MTTPAETRRYTPEDLLTMEDAAHYELVDGGLVERGVSTDSSETAAYVLQELMNFVRPNVLGTVYPPDLGVRAFPDHPDEVRRADVAFVAADRVPPEPGGYLLVAPDLVVEVVSPGDRAEAVLEKVREWFAAGVRLVWVVYPRVRVVEVYRAGGQATVLTADDEIDGEDVIPGFRCPVARFFPQPAATAPPPAQP